LVAIPLILLTLLWWLIEFFLSKVPTHTFDIRGRCSHLNNRLNSITVSQLIIGIVIERIFAECVPRGIREIPLCLLILHIVRCGCLQGLL